MPDENYPLSTLSNIQPTYNNKRIFKMSQLIDIFFLDVNETSFHIGDSSFANSDSTTPPSLHKDSLTENNNIYWRPSHSLYKILHSLYENDYAQFPCIPCSYCSRMIYPHSAKMDS